MLFPGKAQHINASIVAFKALYIPMRLGSNYHIEYRHIKDILVDHSNENIFSVIINDAKNC